MILSAHQPAYLPWLGYFHKIALCDSFVLLDNVQFEKNSYTNRNKIKTSQGEIWVTVPVQMVGHMQKMVSDMEISNKMNWKEKHWKSIYLNYKKAPFFYKYSEFFEDVYKRDWDKLADLLEHMLGFYIAELGIEVKMYKQSELEVNDKKQELILSLCKQLKADTFVFGRLGENYADAEYFKDNNIKIYFQDYKHPVYTQLWGEFIPNISIIDALFNLGSKRTMEVIMEGNIHKEELRGMFL